MNSIEPAANLPNNTHIQAIKEPLMSRIMVHYISTVAKYFRDCQ
jgi:hypothetical protein